MADPLPPELIRANQALKEIAHPDILRSELATVSGGHWALRVYLRPGAEKPLDLISNLVGNHKVLFEDGSGQMMSARPAFPSKGE
jgi:hypothetical protein